MKRRIFIAVVAIAIAAGLFFAERQVWLLDDRGHEDGLYLREEIANAKREGRTRLGVIPVNGGSWLAVCLVSTGDDPQRVLRNFGKKNRLRVPTIQRIRSWLYVGHVPNGEMALVILTPRYSIRSRRLPDDIADPAFKNACALRSDDGLRWK